MFKYFNRQLHHSATHQPAKSSFSNNANTQMTKGKNLFGNRTTKQFDHSANSKWKLGYSENFHLATCYSEKDIWKFFIRKRYSEIECSAMIKLNLTVKLG